MSLVELHGRTMGSLVSPRPGPHGARMNHCCEEDLVSTLLDQIQAPTAPWDIASVGTEFDYRRGRADVVAVSRDGIVVAFEAKMDRWKVALWQAYRNTCFAHRSYVVLPSERAHSAHRRGAEFERLGVGLCSVEEEGIVILVESNAFAPIQPWLTEKAVGSTCAGARCDGAISR